MEMSNSVSMKCKILLEKGLDKETCYDFRKVRAYVMCHTWELMEKEKIPFREAIRRSWADTKKGCAEVSAII